jgi:hypothetical protein
MDLIIYRFWDRKWVEVHHLTQKDVALLVDKSNKHIYIYEGLYATPQKQIDAKTMLGAIKQQYSAYKFRMIGTGTPDEISQKLNEALKDTQELQTQLNHNKNQLELTLRICGGVAVALLTSLLILVIIKFANPFLWELIKADTLKQGELQIDSTQFSKVFRLFGILALFSIIFVLFIAIISGIGHNYKKLGISAIPIIGLFILYEGIWHPKVNQLISIPVSAQIYFSTFLWSIILISIAILGVIGSLLVQKVKLPSSQKGSNEPKTESLNETIKTTAESTTPVISETK